jgi:hypothetical protein
MAFGSTTSATSEWLRMYGLGTRHPVIALSRTVGQCRGIRKRLRCTSVLVKTNVEGSGPVDRETFSITAQRLVSVARRGKVRDASVRRQPSRVLEHLFETRPALERETHVSRILLGGELGGADNR